MNIEKELEAVKKWLDLLENGRGSGDGSSVVEMDLTLPESDIDGLHFNETEVHAVFDKQDGGWYHSRDILFLSARNSADDNNRDILTEYLNSYGFKNCIAEMLPEEVFGVVTNLDKINVSLPEESEGVKKYNGTVCGYWLASPLSGSSHHFCTVARSGVFHSSDARFACGAAPAFCVKKEDEK
jgi:hypothetical protein